MSKKITEEILLKAGFLKKLYYDEDGESASIYADGEITYTYTDKSFMIELTTNIRGETSPFSDLFCSVYKSVANLCTDWKERFGDRYWLKEGKYWLSATIDITSIEHFNKLMEVVGIDFRLK